MFCCVGQAATTGMDMRLLLLRREEEEEEEDCGSEEKEGELCRVWPGAWWTMGGWLDFLGRPRLGLFAAGTPFPVV